MALVDYPPTQMQHTYTAGSKSPYISLDISLYRHMSINPPPCLIQWRNLLEHSRRFFNQFLSTQNLRAHHLALKVLTTFLLLENPPPLNFTSPSHGLASSQLQFTPTCLTHSYILHLWLLLYGLLLLNFGKTPVVLLLTHDFGTYSS